MAPPKLDNILVSVEPNGVGLVKYNRPKNANALSGATMRDMLKAFNWVLEEPEVKLIVVTGEGKFFNAGMDLVGLPEDGPVLPDGEVEALSQTHKALINAEKVLIAAVNGPAVGWGVSSIALFDLVYAVPDAFFFTPFIKWGLNPEACSSVSFTRIMGRQKASLLILANERMTAQDLEKAGLISKILPKEGFFDEVMKVANKIIKEQPPGALKYAKNLMMANIREELLAANERECIGLKERGRTSEPREAIAAFEREQAEKKKSAKL